MVFDDLSVRVSANVRDFNRGISSAQENLGDLSTQSVETSGALQLLQNRADEGGDEIDSAGRSAATTTGLFSALTASTSGLNVSFGLLSTSTFVTVGAFGALTVAAGTLLTALAPIAVTLGGIVTAGAAVASVFGAIIGTGILAFGQQRGEQNQERLEETQSKIQSLKEQNEEFRREAESLRDLRQANGDLSASEQNRLEILQSTISANEDEISQLEERSDKLEEQTGIMGGLKDAMADLREELAGIIVEFGEQFIPLIEDGIDAIPDLVRNIFSAMGGMDEFARTLREIGRVAFSIIPDFVALLVDIARRALPVINRGLESLRNNTGQVGRVIDGLANIMFRSLPLLVSFGQSLINLAGPVLRLGTNVLEAVLPALTDFVGFIRSGVNWMNTLIQTIQGEGNQTLAEFASALLQDISGTVQTALGTAVDAISSWIGNNRQEITDAFVVFTDEIAGAFDVAGDVLSNFITRAREWLENPRNLKSLNRAFSAILNISQAAFGNVAEILGTFIDEAAKFLSKEENQARIANAFDALVDGIQTNLDIALGQLTTWLEKDRNQTLIRKAFRRGFEILGNVLENIMQSFIDYLESDDFKSDIETAGDTLGRAFANAFLGAMQGVTDAAGGDGGSEQTSVRERLVNLLGPGGIIGPRIFGAIPGAQTGAFVSSGGLAMLHQGERVVPAAQVTDRGQVQVDASSGPIEVVVKGDTGVIEDVTARKMDEQSRRNRRNSGRTTTINR